MSKPIGKEKIEKNTSSAKPTIIPMDKHTFRRYKELMKSRKKTYFSNLHPIFTQIINSTFKI